MRVEIGSSIRWKLRSSLRRSGRREIGGVIMGEQLSPGHFRIVDLTVDNETGGRAHFVRSPELHSQALHDFFERTGNEYDRFNYLGEWHSHPRFPVNPSIQDAGSMFELVHGERQIDFAVLLIVRLDWWWKLSASCTLFQRGRDAAPAEIQGVSS